MKNLTNNQKRYIYYWAWVFVTKIAAFLILGFRFGFFSKETGTVTRWSFAAMFVIIWAIFGFWAQFVEYARTMKEGLMREILVSISNVFLPLVLWGAGILAKVFISQYMFFTGTILVTSVFGVILHALHSKYKREVLIKEQGYVNVIR
jgi:predicted metal-binding membrane protein